MLNHTYRLRNTAFRQIKRWSGGAKAWLRRDGASDRPVTAVIVDTNPRDRDLVMLGAKRILIAAKDLSAADYPDREQDVIVYQAPGSTVKEVFAFNAPIRGPRPSGVPIFFDCEVVYDSRDI